MTAPLANAPKLRRRSLLRKLTMMSGAVAALTVGVIAVFMIRLQEKSVLRELEARARDIAAALEKKAMTYILSDDYQTHLALDLFRATQNSPDIEFIVVTERDGHSLIQQPRQLRVEQLDKEWRQAASTPESAEIRHWQLAEGPCLRLSRQININGIYWGQLHVGLSLSHYQAALRRTYQLTGGVAGGTFLLASMFSFFLARHVTSPIRQLQQFAQRVAAGNTTARVTIDSQDEIADLAESINSMIAAISTSQQKLRKSLEEQSALREKDVLLREIHHRVKNNMQMLSSLMRLQSRRADTPEARDILRGSEARIRSMGLLHERLYQSESLSSIDMRSYLNTLTQETLRLSAGGAGKREIRLSVHGIQMGIDTALPCGLIVTELLQNSLKYAFPEGQDGVILVSLSQNDERTYSLIVWDNGVGFPPGFEPASSNSLGMRLVRMLTDQLHGKLTLDGSQGARTEVAFQEAHYKNRF